MRAGRNPEGYIPRPTPADAPREFDATVTEYISWGRTQGGRFHRPWDEHADNREAKLDFWKKELRLELVGDLIGCQARVETALRKLLAENIGDEEEPHSRTTLTVQRYADAITAFTAWATERQYFKDDPLKRLAKLTREPRNKRRALTRDEIGKLLEHCNPGRRLLYVLALASGLRANELRSMTVAHVDFDQGGIKLDAAWTKNRKPGFQYLSGSILEALRAAAAGKGRDDPDSDSWRAHRSRFGRRP